MKECSNWEEAIAGLDYAPFSKLKIPTEQSMPRYDRLVEKILARRGKYED